MKEKDIFGLGNIPKFDTSNFPKIEPLDITKYVPDITEPVQFNPEDNFLFQIKQNQEIEIEKLKELNSKKDIEIENLKLSAKKERKRFWITYAITTFIAVVGIVLGIIF